MKKWNGSYARGQRALARHRLCEAIREFSRAIELCPVVQKRELSLSFHYLALALERAGRSDCALKSWNALLSLRRCDLAARAASRSINEYGQRKRISREADDWFAFRAVHVGRYLSRRGGGNFCSPAEEDAVNDLIFDAWKRLSRSGLLAGLSCPAKMLVFRRCRVSLPFLYLEDALEASRGPDINCDISWVALTHKKGLPAR